ncbi:MAG: hypothetical protein K0Q79_3700 [Flavipsychrobacter sp.]|nr:hypothetical protein [Flavipsychrobacter sp.]
MRNQYSNSPGKRNGGGGFKKKNDKPFDKNPRSFKRNSDDRNTGEDKRAGKRWEDNDRKPRGEFDKDRKPFKKNFDSAGEDRKPRREFDKDKKPFKRDFDRDGGDRPKTAIARRNIGMPITIVSPAGNLIRTRSHLSAILIVLAEIVQRNNGMPVMTESRVKSLIKTVSHLTVGHLKIAAHLETGQKV